MKITALFSLYSLAVVDAATLEQWLRFAALLAPIIVGIVHCLRRPPRREPKRTRSKLPLAVMAAAVVVALCTGTGCMKSSLAQLVQAMGSDTNAVSIDVRSPWGSVNVRRNAQ
jgi:uncharacterized BrkB/YihY/UPF0761 family membrane protein